MRNKKNFLKNFIYNNFKNLNFQILNLNVPRWLTIIWSIIWIVSLFLPWIINEKNKNYWNSFYAISGNIWFLLLILLILIIALTFWSNYKEKMKLYSEIDIKNYSIILFTGILMILSGIIIWSFSVWIQTFEKDIIYWKGLILCVVSGIFIIIWWYLTRKDFYKNSSEIILEKLSQDRKKEKTKDNLSFPF